jgi:hypothetical protein
MSPFSTFISFGPDACGLFTEEHKVERDYLSMEERLHPAALVCLIWDGMRDAGDQPLQLPSAPHSKRRGITLSVECARARRRLLALH